MSEFSLEDFVYEISRAANEFINDVKIGANEVGEDLLSVAQHLSPLDEGGHMQTGRRNPATFDGSNVTVKVGFNKEYSLKLHEDIYNLGKISAQKPSYDGLAVGRKYLSRPLYKNGQKYTDYIVDKATHD
ncbi:hypothetical protein NL868_001317 [Shigella flexneri]|nr:hypothetical protein [Shigella flexneri]